LSFIVILGHPAAGALSMCIHVRGLTTTLLLCFGDDRIHGTVESDRYSIAAIGIETSNKPTTVLQTRSLHSRTLVAINCTLHALQTIFVFSPHTTVRHAASAVALHVWCFFPIIVANVK